MLRDEALQKLILKIDSAEEAEKVRAVGRIAMISEAHWQALFPVRVLGWYMTVGNITVYIVRYTST